MARPGETLESPVSGERATFRLFGAARSRGGPPGRTLAQYACLAAYRDEIVLDSRAPLLHRLLARLAAAVAR